MIKREIFKDTTEKKIPRNKDKNESLPLIRNIEIQKTME